MTYEPIVISLPIADRPRSYEFYGRAVAYAGAFSDPDGHIWMVRTEPPPP